METLDHAVCLWSVGASLDSFDAEEAMYLLPYFAREL
jgi:hypothetical protein